MIASNLVLFLLRPLPTTATTASARASSSTVDRFFFSLGRPLGLPDCPLLKRVWRGGFAEAASKSPPSSRGIGRLRLAGEVIKAAAAQCVAGPLAGQGLPAADCGVDIDGI